MPTYEFIHDADNCKHEWEEIRSITAPEPTHCPKCHAEGNIIHLISGGSGKGIVELQGQELIDKCKADAKKIQKDASKSENAYANLLGESHYQNLQTQMDRRGR